MITLVLGGQRSGKSDFALGLLDAAAAPWVFVATGKALDDGFRAQIAAHRAGRSASLPLLEAGPDLAGALSAAAGAYRSLLVDSLDFWLFAAGEAAQERAAQLDALLAGWHDAYPGQGIILVSAEVGLGPVAASASARAYVRALGTLNQSVARRADRVYLVAAGLPLQLK